MEEEQKELFNLDKLKNLRSKVKIITNFNEIEVTNEVCIPGKKIADAILLQQENLNNNNNNIINSNTTNNNINAHIQNIPQDCYDYILNEFFPCVAKDLLSHGDYKNNDAYQLVEEFIDKIVKIIAITIKHDHVRLSETFKYIFDITNSFYRLNNQWNHDYLFAGRFFKNKQRQEWAQQLKEGDIIDAIKFENIYKSCAWSRGVVLHILQEAQRIKVGFLSEREKFDQYFDLNSHQIAPLGTYSQDFDWRMSLKEGDLCDVMDPLGVWYNGTVLESRVRQSDRGEDIVELKLAYRVYNEKGNQTDEQGRRFSGWSDLWDDWFTATSTRIQKNNKMAKSLYKKCSQKGCDKWINDTLDLEFEPLYSELKLAAIVRPSESQSVALTRFLNTFHERDGFNSLLQRVKDRKNWYSLELLSNFIYALGSLHGVFIRFFCIEYIPSLWEAVKENILKSPDQHMRLMEINKLEVISKGFNTLLRRAYSIGQKNKEVETFTFDVALFTFNCSFLQQKVVGMKIIGEIVRSLKRKDYENYQSPQFIAWISDNKIFDKIFSINDSHEQIVLMAPELMRFLFEKDFITVENVEQCLMLYQSAVKSGNKEMAQCVFKNLTDISTVYKSQHIEKIIEIVSQVQAEEIDLNYIELVYEATKFSSEQKVKDKTLLWLWQLLEKSHKLKDEKLKDKIVEKFISAVREKEEKWEFVEKCMQNIKSNNQVSTSLRILKQIIESFPLRQKIVDSTNKLSQQDVVQKIVTETDLPSLIFQNLKHLKASVSKHLDQNDEMKQTYLKKLEERIIFLRFCNDHLPPNSPQIIGCDFLFKLWDEIVMNSTIPDERDRIFNWLKDFETKNVEEIIKFYNQKVLSEEALPQLTPTGFLCFQTIFLTINQQNGKISNIKMKSPKLQTTYNNEGKVVSITNAVQDQSQNESSLEQEFLVICDPKELIGIEQTWKIVEKSDFRIFSDQSAEFLVKLYINLDASLGRQNIISIRQRQQIEIFDMY